MHTYVILRLSLAIRFTLFFRAEIHAPCWLRATARGYAIIYALHDARRWHASCYLCHSCYYYYAALRADAAGADAHTLRYAPCYG